MLIPYRHRKTVHTALFISAIIIQILVFVLWFNQNTDQKKLSEAIENARKPNKALEFSNMATKYYLEAGNNFSDYLQDYNPKSFSKYTISLNNMASYLDSLCVLSNKDKDFFQAVNSKKSTERQVVKLRKQLDSLIAAGIIPIVQEDPKDFKVSRFNFKKVLRTISYDTTKTEDPNEKKGFFARIANAIAGKSDLRKELVLLRIKMEYDNVEKTGSFEDQLKNIFVSTDKYYNKEFQKLKSTYNNLRKKDKELVYINKMILSNSQDIILFYSKSAQESGKIKYQNAIDRYYIDIKSQKNLILTLLVLMVIITILLLIYTLFAYLYEKDLSKAKLEAEKNLEFKNRLIGMLSHEMRAPLNIISNFSSKLKISNENSALKPIINSLHFTTNSLQITVNQILDFFKNENTKLIMYNSHVNLKDEVVSIIDSLKSLAEIKKIELISKIDNSLENEVWADNGKIHQLFYNIIGNAIKFTKKGNITITANLIKIENKYKLDVKIKDTGVGIPAEDLKNVFDKYYQSKFYTEQISFGAGLGLSLCKEIVELYDGEISVESQINKGTEISFYLLLEKTHSISESNENKLISKFKDKKIKIALVDDDLLMLTVMKKLLTNINFEVLDFSSRSSIKEYLNENRVDAIITDLQISELSGVELAKEIKTNKNLNSNTPIIAITGDNYMDTIDLSTIYVDGILIKPINKEELYTKLLKLLQ